MDDLYRQELLELYRNPQNRGVMLKPHMHALETNPLCGDQVEIFLRFDDKGKVKDATFDGKGCVISMASTSLLLSKILGKTRKEIQDMTTEDILDLIGINLTPSRVKCAVLPLSTLKKGIIEQEEKNKISVQDKSVSKSKITQSKIIKKKAKK